MGSCNGMPLESDDILIKVEGVSKKFCRNLRRSLWYGLKDIVGGIGGQDIKAQLRKDEFWAVRDISFELRRGECLGLIGHNGAGKSTLLKMLNGLIRPDDGCIHMRGKIGALIELGAGFNPILSGRENIYTNAAVLGFSRQEIDRKFNEIVSFSELGAFLDMPVQNYSSGMKVRLGFAIAAQMQPDILIIDEVLAVGDVGFRIKCFNAINNLAKKTAIIFVSHSMPYIARISTKILLMDHGRAIYQGAEVSEGIEKYFNAFENEPMTVQGDKVQIVKCEMWSNSLRVDMTADEHANVHYKSQISTKLVFTSRVKVDKLKIAQTFFDKEMKALAVTNILYEEIAENKEIEVEIILNDNQFSPGVYNISFIFYAVGADNRVETLSNYRAINSFKVVGTQDISHAPFLLDSIWKKIEHN